MTKTTPDMQDLIETYTAYIERLQAEIARLRGIIERRNMETMADQQLAYMPCAFGCGRYATVWTSSDDYVCQECKDGFEDALDKGTGDPQP